MSGFDQGAIQQILAKKSIVAYLEEKGFLPYKILTGGKMSYLCPFPDHQENKPSFMVWTNSDYENFHCFGCQRNHSIIDLVSGMERIPFRKAVERLAEGLEITVDESINLDLQRIAKLGLQRTNKEFSDVLMSVASLCRSYLESINYDSSEQCIIDRLFRQVDIDLSEYEFDKIEETLKNLPAILARRREKYEVTKLQEQVKNYAS